MYDWKVDNLLTRLRAFQRQTEDSHALLEISTSEGKAWVVISVVPVVCAFEVLTGEGTDTSDLLVSDDREGARSERSGKVWYLELMTIPLGSAIQIQMGTTDLY